MVHSADGDETIATPPGADARLTVRERAVLTASATGMVVAEVAESLGLTPEDVRSALRSAIAKLGTRSKLEAIIVALRRGMIDIPGDQDAGLA